MLESVPYTLNYTDGIVLFYHIGDIIIGFSRQCVRSRQLFPKFVVD